MPRSVSRSGTPPKRCSARCRRREPFSSPESGSQSRIASSPDLPGKTCRGTSAPQSVERRRRPAAGRHLLTLTFPSAASAHPRAVAALPVLLKQWAYEAAQYIGPATGAEQAGRDPGDELFFHHVQHRRLTLPQSPTSAATRPSSAPSPSRVASQSRAAHNRQPAKGRYSGVIAPAPSLAPSRGGQVSPAPSCTKARRQRRIELLACAPAPSHPTIPPAR